MLHFYPTDAHPTRVPRSWVEIFHQSPLSPLQSSIPSDTTTHPNLQKSLTCTQPPWTYSYRLGTFAKLSSMASARRLKACVKATSILPSLDRARCCKRHISEHIYIIRVNMLRYPAKKSPFDQKSIQHLCSTAIARNSEDTASEELLNPHQQLKVLTLVVS